MNETEQDIRARIVAAAASQIDVTDPSRYWLDVLDPPQAHPKDAHGKPLSWCGAFCLAVLHMAGVALRTKWRGGFLEPVCPKRGPGELPQPGDVGYLTQFQHHCLVEWYDAQTGIVGTIDGNSGQVSGGVVVRNQRPRSRFAGFYDPSPLFGQTAPAAPRPAPPVAPKPTEPSPVVVRLSVLDLSSYQPATLDYGLAKALGVEHVIVRVVRRGIDPDEAAVDHCRRARAAGLTVSGYHFFHPGRPVSAQLDVLRARLDACGIGPGDVAPALDLESFTGNAATPAWVGPASEMLARVADEWGAAIRYHNVADYVAMGRPSWSAYPLWLAAYGQKMPTSCGTPVLWQYASSLVPGLGMALDQNALLGTLPRIAVPVVAPPVVPLDDRQVAALAADAAMRGIR